MLKINKWDINPQNNSASFHYHCSVYGSFSEVITFPATVSISDKAKDKKFLKLLDVMAAYIGVSYYKLNASNEIEFDFSFSNVAKGSIEKIYTDGLGEFFIRNNLNYPPEISFRYKDSDDEVSNSLSEEDLRAVEGKTVTVAFGGGKDSHVSISLLDTLKINQELVSVVLAETVESTLKKLSHKDITFIKRKIDPKLITLGKKGEGYNGHIPITAINSIILSAYSYLAGNNWVVFSNERGASVPTMHHGKHEINHQYSKSLGFEYLYRNTLNDICGSELQYFSLLRPFSELWIAAYLGREAQLAHDCFSSCNRNFVFEGKNKLKEGERWCGECSKCIYTAIITAPHISKTEFTNIFGSNILNDPNNIQVAKDLCGIGNAKPWECVGDFVDTATSLFYLSFEEDWVKDIVPKQLAELLHKKYGGKYLDERFTSEMLSRSTHFLPNQLAELGKPPYLKED